MAENQETNLSQQHPAESNPSLLPSAKRTWPELVGLTAEEAERKIKEDFPRVEIQVILPDCFVTMDFKQDRVRLYVDGFGKVARIPRIG